MRKFTVSSKRGELIIYELDVQVLTALDDAGTMFLKPGEYMARILKPESFHMKRERTVDGKKETYLEPDVWYSHALYDTYGEALQATSTLIEQEFAFKLRKYGTAYSDVDVAAALLALKLEKLPGSDFKTDAEKVQELLASQPEVT